MFGMKQGRRRFIIPPPSHNPPPPSHNPPPPPPGLMSTTYGEIYSQIYRLFIKSRHRPGCNWIPLIMPIIMSCKLLRKCITIKKSPPHPLILCVHKNSEYNVLFMFYIEVMWMEYQCALLQILVNAVNKTWYVSDVIIITRELLKPLSVF